MKLDIESLIKKAAEASKHAPEHLQEAAFNKAFDALMSANQGSESSQVRNKPSSADKSVYKDTGKTSNSSTANSLDELNRTGHPEINHNGTALNNSLRLLRAAKDELGVDGISAASIANILVEKFRCQISRQAVSKALNDAGRYVNRNKDRNLVIFRIMAPGDEYLDGLEESSEKEKTPTKGKKTGKKKGSKKKSKTSTTKKKKSSSSSKTGPATVMSQLYDKGYFSSARTIKEIIDKLKHDSGRAFKSNELSPVLLRWLRSDKLSRKQNSDNQYEYKQ